MKPILKSVHIFYLLIILINRIRSLLIGLCIALSSLVPYNASGQVSVVTQHNNVFRTGGNTNEKILTTANVTKTTFGKIGGYNVDDQIYAQPLIVSNIAIPGKGNKNVLYIATVNNTVYAFDADQPNSPFLWKTNLSGPNALPVNATDINASGACGGNYKDFSGNFGIVGTPVIDTITGTMYLVARTKESNKAFVQKLHAISISDGTSKSGSPVIITASVNGTGTGNVNGIIKFDPLLENQRPALLLVNGIIYISWASQCDSGPYHGWVIGYNASSLQQVSVYNNTKNGAQGGIWMSGQGPAADENGNIYLSSGNGTYGYNGNTKDSTNLGDSFVKLSSSLIVKDWFTPYNYQYLQDHDLDLGSSGPMLIPNTKLLVGGGKEGVLYVMNRDKMGRLNSQQNNNQIVQSFLINNATNNLHGSTIYYSGPTGEFIYVWLEYDYLKAYKFDRPTNKFILPWSSKSTMRVPNGMPGGMLSVSSNGLSSGTGIVWACHPYSGNANNETRPGIIRAFDARDVSKELWNSMQDSVKNELGSFAKFNSPTIANGKVYCPTFSNKVVVYGLTSGNPVVLRTPENPASTVAGVSYSYYQGVFNSLPDFSKLTPVKTGTVSNFTLSPKLQNDNFAFQYKAFINVPVDGYYSFFTASDDGSRLFIGDELVVDNDSRHLAQERWGAIGLKAGKHAITVQYFDFNSTDLLTVSYSGPGISKQVIPASVLFIQSTITSLRNPENPANAVNGLDYSYYEGTFTILPNFSSLTAIKTGTVTNFDLSQRRRDDYFAFKFTGYVNVPSDGIYTFYTSSDDGSKLYIGSQEIVSNDSLHASRERSGTIGLKAGKHAITVGFFEYNGGQVLTVSYAGPGITKQVIPASALYRVTNGITLRDPENPANTVNGCNYNYYEGQYTTIPNTDLLTPVKTGVINNFTISPRLKSDYFVFKFSGYIQVNADGVYTFYTNSDDGSKLYIGNQVVVNNDGLHALKELSGTIGLKAGKHAITVSYLEYTGSQVLNVSYAGPSLAKQLIPDAAIFRVNAMNAAKLASMDSVQVSPIPTADYVNIAFYEDVQEVKISVVDMSGNVFVKSRTAQVEKRQTKFYLGDLNEGIYMLHIEMNNGMGVSRRIIVSK